MLFFNRRKFLSAICLITALSGCGFEPIYGEGTAASRLYGKIDVVSGPGRSRFEVRERLVERFGFANGAKYRLTFTYDVKATGLAVSSTAEITRFNFNGTSNYTITDIASGAVLFEDTVHAVTAFSATTETYPTRVADQDARSRLALALADQIVTRVSATASKWAE